MASRRSVLALLSLSRASMLDHSFPHHPAPGAMLKPGVEFNKGEGYHWIGR